MLNRIDVYTVMLGVALSAVLVGVLLLAIELSRFGGASPTAAISRTPAPSSQLVDRSYVTSHGSLNV